MFLPDSPRWQPSPRSPILHAGEVHVWRVWLDQDRPLAELAAALAPDERSRAERFLFDHDRRRFVAARAALRMLLGRLTQVDPARVEIATARTGKPELAGTMRACDLRFNLSHGGDIALVAVALGREVGVDVESCAREVDHAGVAEQLFSADERRELATAEPSLRRRRFFELWTRREALLKASGEGLALPLADLDIAQWSVTALAPAPEYAAAVAVRGEMRALFAWEGSPAPPAC